MFLLLKDRHFELVRRLDCGVILAYIVPESFRDGGLLEDCLPWALRLASAAIDTLVWLDVELVGKLFPVVAYVFIDAVNRAHTDASCIETVPAKTGYGPGHMLSVTAEAVLNRQTA
jgi:hypothetical protein